MLTLYDISLAVARIVTPENMTDGDATAGTTTSLTDTVNLLQPNEYYNKGILWIHSGTHARKILSVTGHYSNKLTFATPGTAIQAGDRYTVARDIYPYQRIKSAINTVLQETHIEAKDSTLEGDGETLSFTLPDGVWDVKRVYFTDPGNPTEEKISTHWKEQYTGTTRKLKFDYGCQPNDGYTINVIYRDQHPELTTYSSEINAEINTEWLKYKSAESLLLWAVGKYQTQSEYRVEERMNMVLERLKRMSARMGGPDVIVKTAGA